MNSLPTTFLASPSQPQQPFSEIALCQRVHPSALPLVSGMAVIESRARGCLFGQVAGDSLGSHVEYKSEQEIKELYPEGVRLLPEPNSNGLLPGQGTDDSEMALVLAKNLLSYGMLKPKQLQAAYCYWLASAPQRVGSTTQRSLSTCTSSAESVANGALMRVSPLGVFCVGYSESEAMNLGKEEASITHSHKLCLESSALYVATIRLAILSSLSPVEIYRHILKRAEMLHLSPLLLSSLKKASVARPQGYFSQMGNVLLSLHNAFYELLHAKSLEEAVENSVARGGDTDTNAAICGAMLGAVYGEEAVPQEWRDYVLSCTPAKDTCRVPRPEEFWTKSLPGLAKALVAKAKLLPLAGQS